MQGWHGQVLAVVPQQVISEHRYNCCWPPVWSYICLRMYKLATVFRARYSHSRELFVGPLVQPPPSGMPPCSVQPRLSSHWFSATGFGAPVLLHVRLGEHWGTWRAHLRMVQIPPMAGPLAGPFEGPDGAPRRAHHPVGLRAGKRPVVAAVKEFGATIVVGHRFRGYILLRMYKEKPLWCESAGQKKGCVVRHKQDTNKRERERQW